MDSKVEFWYHVAEIASLSMLDFFLEDFGLQAVVLQKSKCGDAGWVEIGRDR